MFPGFTCEQGFKKPGAYQDTGSQARWSAWWPSLNWFSCGRSTCRRSWGGLVLCGLGSFQRQRSWCSNPLLLMLVLRTRSQIIIFLKHPELLTVLCTCSSFLSPYHHCILIARPNIFLKRCLCVWPRLLACTHGRGSRKTVICWWWLREGGREVRIDEARARERQRERALSLSVSFSLCDSGSQPSSPLLLLLQRQQRQQQQRGEGKKESIGWKGLKSGLNKER